MSATPYKTEEIERALWAIALNAGSVTRASRDLEAAGHPINKQTLHEWKTDRHATRYHEIQTEAQAKISEKVAAEAEAFLLASAATQRAMLDQLNEALENRDIKPGEIPAAMRNLATTQALANDKIIGPLRGRPNIIEHHHTADELVRKLRSLMPKTIETTAEDITERGPSSDGAGLNVRELEASKSEG